MSPIPVMVNGLPGNVAATLIPHILKNNHFTLLPVSLTGPDTKETRVSCHGVSFDLMRPESRDSLIRPVLEAHPGLVAIDYTHPSAVNANADFYARHAIPFVMGTTGGDREALFQTVRQSSTSAVIAPNMAKQIVGFQAMMAYAAQNFPGLFEGYSLRIEESHQAGKADTSGTARAMVESFNALGIPFSVEEIEMERNPEQQQKIWGIPEAHLKGHAWHTYTLVSPDKNAMFRFVHNINGRDIYAQGTLDAVRFLVSHMKKSEKGRIFSMMDVLKDPACPASA